jgi:hypothetical protein
MTQHEDFAKYYALENYLFSIVSNRFHDDKTLSAFDFFCIIIWKANRSKSKIARRLLEQGDGHATLEGAVAALFRALSEARDSKQRLAIFVQTWGFRLPMASAILTVLYPHDFTVYDIRVCEVLHDFEDAQYKQNFDVLWRRYEAYVDRVRKEVPLERSLRDKDRFLWGKSFAQQLQSDIADRFGHSVDDAELDA